MAKGSLGGKRGRGTTADDMRSGKLNSQYLAGQTYFYDGNNTSTRATVDNWESKRGDLDHEELLMVDDDGFAIGYFKGDKDSVAFNVPRGVDTSKITLTHNHPTSGDARSIGGSFSDADIKNHLAFGFKETRATAKEGTYSFKTTSESDAKGFSKALSGRKTAVNKAYDDTVSSMKKKGYTLTETEGIDLYLRISDSWYKATASKYGYEYTFTKRR